MSDIGDFHGLCVGFVVFWVGSPHMGGGALFAAKPGYAQPLGALGLNYSVIAVVNAVSRGVPGGPLTVSSPSD